MTVAVADAVDAYGMIVFTDDSGDSGAGRIFDGFHAIRNSSTPVMFSG